MDDSTASVVRAARRAFAQYGVDRTKMADVARSAGVVRQTIYNSVSSRDELLELALVQCCEELQERIDAWVRTAPEDIREALVEFLAVAVEITGGDDEFAALAAGLKPERVKAILGDSYPVQSLIAQSVRPILVRAEAANLLRDNVSVDEASRWLQGVLTFALLRDVHDRVELRTELRKFALPSVFVER